MPNSSNSSGAEKRAVVTGILREILPELNLAIARTLGEYGIDGTERHFQAILDFLLGLSTETEHVVLMADVAGYTRLCQEVSPEEIALFLHDHARCVADLLEEEGGFVARMEGDGAYLVFPSFLDHATERATRVGFRLIEAFGKNRLARKCPGGLYVVISKGRLTPEIFRLANRVNYTISGDVFQAADLMKKDAPANKVVVDGLLRNEVGENHRTRKLKTEHSSPAAGIYTISKTTNKKL